MLLTDAIAGIEKLCGELFAVIYLACSHFVCCALPTELWLKRRVESLSIDVLFLCKFLLPLFDPLLSVSFVTVRSVVYQPAVCVVTVSTMCG